MKILILFILLTSTLFSQKLWEIEVNPNDLLRDVMEIPNSDLLLFTYNTGKLEIRNSIDGSFVNQLISKPHESGDLRISKTGKYYHLQNYNYNASIPDNDTIEIRDIRNNEVYLKFSPSINNLELENDFKNKKIFNCFLIENDTKILSRVYYTFGDGQKVYGYFFIYNIVTKEYEKIEDVVLGGDYSAISKSYLSPDEKYIIEISAIKSKARLFDIQNKVYSKEFDGSIGDEESYKVEALKSYIFNKNDKMIYMSGTGFYIRSFPNLNLDFHFELVSNLGIYPANIAKYYLCNDELFFISGEKVPGGGSQDFRFWHLKFNISSKEIIYNSKSLYTFKSMFNSFVINDCNKIIISKDFDNRDGIIACYEYNTLDVENQSVNTNYFLKENNLINFNSQDFIGQIANIDIFNSTGIKVGALYNGILNQPNYNFNLPELPSGAYYLQCQLTNQNLNFNFVVVR